MPKHLYFILALFLFAAILLSKRKEDIRKMFPFLDKYIFTTKTTIGQF